MRIEEWKWLHGIVSDAARELFNRIGADVSESGIVPSGEVDWAETLGIIGLGGKLRGSLVLSVPPAMLRRTHPMQAVARDDLHDWLAEITNLVLGDIKVRLLSRDIETERSTPLLISATSMRLERFAGAPAAHFFVVRDGVAHVVFEAVAAEGVSLAPRNEHVLAAGDIVTF